MRKTYLDIGKILACFAVILQHCCDLGDPSSVYYDVNNLYYYFARFAVPVFVMASGALLLDKSKSVSIRKVLRKYIPRMCIALLFIRYLIVFTNDIMLGTFTYKSFLTPITSVIFNQVNVPYWYIYLMIGLYLVLPFVKKMVDNCTKREIEYFLIGFIIVRSILPFVYEIGILQPLASTVGGLQLGVYSGYLGYFILGYYIDVYLHPKLDCKLVLVNIVSLFLPLVFVYMINISDMQTKASLVNDVFSINCLIFASSFLLILKRLPYHNWKPRTLKICSQLSGLTFGVYLFHVYVMQLFSSFNIHIITESPIIQIPLYAFIVLIISSLFTYLCKKINFLKNVL